MAQPEVELPPTDYTPARPRANINRLALIDGDDELVADTPRQDGTPLSLDDEINAYLLDAHVGTSALAYWQVRY